MGNGHLDNTWQVIRQQPGALNTTAILKSLVDKTDVVFHIGDISYARGYANVVSIKRSITIKRRKRPQDTECSITKVMKIMLVGWLPDSPLPLRETGLRDVFYYTCRTCMYMQNLLQGACVIC